MTTALQKRSAASVKAAASRKRFLAARPIMASANLDAALQRQANARRAVEDALTEFTLACAEVRAARIAAAA
jgi:hypothetical protein